MSFLPLNAARVLREAFPEARLMDAHSALEIGAGDEDPG